MVMQRLLFICQLQRKLDLEQVLALSQFDHMGWMPENKIEATGAQPSQPEIA